METTLTSKGQITLPKSIRHSLHLKSGDKIVFEELENGAYLLKAKTLGVKALKGSLQYTGQFRTLQEMDNAIKANAGNE